MSKLNRKKFLKTSGLSLAAIAFAGGASSYLSGCEKKPIADLGEEVEAVEHPVIVPVTLDPDAASDIAYESYKDGGG